MNITACAPNTRAVIAAINRFTLDMPAAEIPEDVLARVRMLFLDIIRICIAAAPMQAGVLARRIAFDLDGAGPQGDRYTLLFDGRQVSIAGVAFAAATQIDNLDGHDGYNPTKRHLGIVVVLSLVALAEHLQQLSGRDALAVMIVSYEIAGSAGMSPTREVRRENGRAIEAIWSKKIWRGQAGAQHL